MGELPKPLKEWGAGAYPSSRALSPLAVPLALGERRQGSMAVPFSINRRWPCPNKRGAYPLPPPPPPCSLPPPPPPPPVPLALGIRCQRSMAFTLSKNQQRPCPTSVLLKFNMTLVEKNLPKLWYELTQNEYKLT